MEKLETISVPEIARILRLGQATVRRRIETHYYPFGDCERIYTKKSPNGRRAPLKIYRYEFDAYLESIKRGDRNEI